MLADGRRFVAAIDRGYLLTGRLTFDAEGQLAGIAGAEIATLKMPDGRSTRAKARMSDLEAVELLEDGSLLAGFEQHHRVWRYAHPAARPEPYVEASALLALPANGGIEALAPLGGGRLLLLAELGRDARGDVVGWLRGPGGLARLTYLATGSFAPTDMARLADGDVLVLERRFSPLSGFGARLARIAAAAIVPGARLEAAEVARLEWPKRVENFEGLAVAPAPGGGTHVYLVSDDNFRALQETLLLQFLWRP